MNGTILMGILNVAGAEGCACDNFVRALLNAPLSALLNTPFHLCFWWSGNH